MKKKAENYDRIIEAAQTDFFAFPEPPKIKHVYLKGKAAKRLDERVSKAMREYLNGKTKRFKSLRDIT